MPLFRKKPVTIEARQLTEGADWYEIARWCGGLVFEVPGEVLPHLTINTLEGVMTAGKDDWVIRGVKGEFYPCKPDVFTATYEAV